ncbi:MAG: RHS repeat-associated core domain-containing protein, partial [Clostridia bacterium]|nr:RHS repeat-associated core domain-containing protein [Clostridia bacterium]
YNGHGDVVQIVDTAGTVKNSYDYDVWGNFLKKEETIENHFTYFGQTFDETTGLYYLRARYYDPTTGRFTQQDTAEDGYNWYVYGNQNPVNRIDQSGMYGEALINPWIRQQEIWMKGVKALELLGYNLTSQFLHNSLRWFKAEDVSITDYWDGVNISGSDRINGDLVVYSLRNNKTINNEIDWLINCYGKDGFTHFDSGEMVLTLNNTTDLYLSFNNATVKLIGNKTETGSWIVNVNVFDIYDFDIEKLKEIDSFKKAIGGIAGSIAAIEQMPVWGAIKTYNINVNYNIER